MLANILARKDPKDSENLMFLTTTIQKLAKKIFYTKAETLSRKLVLDCYILRLSCQIIFDNW
jgi:hypothetical protein